MTKVTYQKAKKYKDKDVIIYSKTLKDFCFNAKKRNKVDIIRSKKFSRLCLIADGLPMNINRIEDCMIDFFNDFEVYEILLNAGIYTIKY